MTGKPAGYIMHVRHLKKQFSFKDSSIAMNETSVWKGLRESWCQRCFFEDERARKSSSFGVPDCKKGRNKTKTVYNFCQSMTRPEQDSKSLHEELVSMFCYFKY